MALGPVFDCRIGGQLKSTVTAVAHKRQGRDGCGGVTPRTFANELRDEQISDDC